MSRDGGEGEHPVRDVEGVHQRHSLRAESGPQGVGRLSEQLRLPSHGRERGGGVFGPFALPERATRSATQWSGAE